MHELNHAHRDIKPANILIVGEMNGCGLAKLGDFGTAKKIDSDDKQTFNVGTP